MPCTEEICEERQNSLTGSPIPIAGDWDIAIGKESVTGATDIEFRTTRVRSHLTDSLLEYLGTAGEIVEQVDEDDVVSIRDISAAAASFGLSVSDRIDGFGRFVDINGDGDVDILDISAIASNFGAVSPLAWP